MQNDSNNALANEDTTRSSGQTKKPVNGSAVASSARTKTYVPPYRRQGSSPTTPKNGAFSPKAPPEVHSPRDFGGSDIRSPRDGGRDQTRNRRDNWSRDRPSWGGDRGGYGASDARSGGGYDRGGGGGGGGRRFDVADPAPRRGSRGGSRGGAGGGGGGGRFGRGTNTAYDRSTKKNDRLEAELFDSKDDEVQEGINFDKYENIPVETSGVDIPDPIKTFADIDNIHPQLLFNIDRAGFRSPTPVQKHAFPIGVSNRDLMACAQTGSGKTAAFLFPMIQQLLETGGAAEKSVEFSGGHRSKFYPVALILSPTRELSIQIHKQARKFLYRTGMRACCVYGGAQISQQFRDMERGVDIVVATPGRLVDFIDRGRLSLSEVRFLVLDEADRMLDMGFEPQIRQIVERSDMPGRGERQNLMFSATFPREIQFLAQDFMSEYIFLAVGRVGSTTEMIKQEVMYADPQDKIDVLMKQLPECDGLTLIFVQTKRAADQIEDILIQQGVNATSIHGDRSQHEREHALRMFKTQRCPVLVATDVASRGLDIPNVKHVFNYDLPSSIDDYVHRIGRTGRCGNLGTAISFCNASNKNILQPLLEMLKENNQEVPDWFEKLVRDTAFGYRGGGKRRSGRGGFGGRDVRRGGRWIKPMFNHVHSLVTNKAINMKGCEGL